MCHIGTITTPRSLDAQLPLRALYRIDGEQAKQTEHQSHTLTALYENQIKHCHASRSFRICSTVRSRRRRVCVGNLGDDNPVNSIADNFLCLVYLINASAVFAVWAHVLK